VQRASSIAIVIVLLAASAAPAEWPQFLGPTRSGVAKSGKPLARSWPEGGPKVLWTVKLGPGFGGPAVRDGKIYILDHIGEEQDVLRCLDMAKGTELWRFAYDAPGKLGYNGSRSTPTVDRKYIFTIGPFGHVYCFDRATHKPLWSKNLQTDFAGKMAPWGYAHSALLYKDAVILFPGGKTVGVVALDKATGKELWRSRPIGSSAYPSPTLLTADGVDQIVVYTFRGARVAGIDAANGKVLWSYRKWKCNCPVPGPTIIGDGRIFLTGGYKAGSVMLKIQRKDDGKFAATELFKTDDLGSLLHNAVLYKDHLYVNCNTKRTNDGLVCIDLAGNVKWKTERSPNMERGNLIIADGLIYIMDGRTGVLRLVQADPAGYKELAQAKILKHRPIWAPMALTDGKLLCRDQQQLKCLDVSAP